MDQRERFLRTLRYEPIDRRPVYLAGPWTETLQRWRGEGLPADVTDVHQHLGVRDFGFRIANITPLAGPFPRFERRVIREEGDSIYYIDDYGRTVHDFKSTATIPEWVAFPVNCAEDLRRYLDEHFDVTDLDARFGPDWADKARASARQIQCATQVRAIAIATIAYAFDSADLIPTADHAQIRDAGLP